MAVSIVHVNICVLLQRWIANAILVYQMDLPYIKQGAYKLPWDMTTPGHRQTNPFYVIPQLGGYLSDSVPRLGRSSGALREKSADRLPFIQPNMYPRYYQHDFHFQTDGWFSSKSADLYDTQAEALFFGTHDAMQRGALLHISRCIFSFLVVVAVPIACHITIAVPFLSPLVSGCSHCM